MSWGCRGGVQQISLDQIIIITAPMLVVMQALFGIHRVWGCTENAFIYLMDCNFIGYGCEPRCCGGGGGG